MIQCVAQSWAVVGADRDITPGKVLEESWKCRVVPHMAHSKMSTVETCHAMRGMRDWV